MQRLPNYPGGILASPFSIVSGLFNNYLPEGVLIDGKEGPYREPEDFLKDVASFSNAWGGVIVVGAREDKQAGIWVPIGVTEPSRRRVQMRDWLKKLEPPGVPDLSLEIVPFQGHDFIVVQVPRATVRPVAFVANGERVEFWFRDQDANRQMRFAEILEEFNTRYHRKERWSAIAQSLMRRFDAASEALRAVKLRVVVGAFGGGASSDFLDIDPSPSPVMSIGGLCEPLILLYDSDLERAFGRIPEMWVNKGPDGKPHSIRLPGSSAILQFRSDDVQACAQLQSLFEDAGRLCRQFLEAGHVLRGTLSLIGQTQIKPELLWALCIGLEAARMPPGDPLHRAITSWLSSCTFPYQIALEEDLHAPFAHIVSGPQMREAALRRFQIKLDIDTCLLSSIVLLDAIHRAVGR